MASAINLQHNRWDRRISNYNWNKIKNLTNDIDDTIIKRGNNIINTWLLKSATNTNKINPQEQSIYILLKEQWLRKDNRKQRIKLSTCRISFLQDRQNGRRQLQLRKIKGIGDAPGKPIIQSNSYHMSYSDLNYLGSNKAIFYFDRGIKGKEIFNNSMYPLEQQPK